MVQQRPTVDEVLPLGQPMLHILIALGEEVQHGYAIMHGIDARSGGQVRLLPGTLYSTIKKMLAQSLVEECPPPAEAESEDARRRYYRVTAFGRRVLEAEIARLSMLVRLAQGRPVRAPR